MRITEARPISGAFLEPAFIIGLYFDVTSDAATSWRAMSDAALRLYSIERQH